MTVVRMTDTAIEPRLLGTAAWVFVTTTIFLGIQLPLSNIKAGNLIMLAGALVAVACVLASRGYRDRFRYVLYPSDWIYLSYIGWCAASVQWSRSQLDTAVQTAYLVAVWVAVLHLRDVSLRTTLTSLVYATVLVCLASIMVALVLPGVGFQPHSTTGLPELRGIFEHQQRLGLFCAMTLGILGLAWLNGHTDQMLRWQRWKFMGITGIVALTLLAAQARLYTAAFFVSMILTISLSRPGLARKVSLSCLAVIIIFAVLGSEQTMQLVDRIGTEGNTLSGRTTVWQKSIEVAHEAPLFGHGYASFFSKHFDYIWGNYRAPNAHSSFIQAYFETGLVGLVMILLLMSSQIRESLRIGRVANGYSYSFFLVVFAIFSSGVGVTYAGKPTVLFSIVLLFLAVENRQSATRRRSHAVATDDHRREVLPDTSPALGDRRA